MGEELFRKSALDKLASPERLDVLMEVTSPKGWVALLTVGSLLIGLIVWSVFGSIPERVEGQGILVRGGGLRQMTATSDGTLTAFHLEVNDQVKEGQKVGQISQLGGAEEVRAAEQKLDQAKREYENSKAEDEATQAGIRSTIAGIDADKKRTQLSLVKATEDVTRLRDSFKQGLITKNRLDTAEREVNSLQATLTGQDSQIASQGSQIRSYQQKIRARLDAVEKARLDLARLTQKSESMAEILSTVMGRVVEVKKRVGDHVNRNDVVATVEPPSSGIEPFVYIPASNGKRVKKGMEAQISPSTVRREEYGFMRGEISIVGDYAVTADGVRAVVPNDEVIKELLGSNSKIQVKVDLKPDTTTSSGYAWSSSSGPPFRVEGGTKINVSVIVDRRTPISYVLPILKNAIGG
jgi:HlyD family secretion protein